MESFAPQYYLVEGGIIRPVEETVYRSRARLFGNHSLFTSRTVKGFIARSTNERDKHVHFFQEWTGEHLVEDTVDDDSSDKKLLNNSNFMTNKPTPNWEESVSIIALGLNDVENEESDDTATLRFVAASKFRELAKGNVEEVRGFLNDMLAKGEISEHTLDWLDGQLDTVSVQNNLDDEG